MGFIKTIGSKLKRAISIKNAINTVTGNFSAVGKEVLRVSTTKDPNAKKNSAPVKNLPANTVIPPMIQSILEVKGAQQAQKITNTLAGIPAIQDANSFLSGIYIKSLWLKYKTTIIGIASVALVILLLKKFVFSSSSKRGVRKS